MKLKKVLRRIVLSGFAIVCLGGLWALAEGFPKDTFMTSKEAQKKWGSEGFEANKFKIGNLDVRSKMTASLLSNPKPFIGKTVNEIYEIFGPQTGFYRLDMFPAYLISDDGDRGGESWQILFVLNKEYKVIQIKLHKNCCS